MRRILSPMFTNSPINCPQCKRETKRNGYDNRNKNPRHRCHFCNLTIITDFYGNRRIRTGKPKGAITKKKRDINHGRDEESRKKFRELIHQGITYLEMAKTLNVCIGTLYSWRKKEIKYLEANNLDTTVWLERYNRKENVFDFPSISCPRCDGETIGRGYSSINNLRYLCNECRLNFTIDRQGNRVIKGGRPIGSGLDATYDPNHEKRQKFRELRQQEVTFKEIAKILDVCCSTLYVWKYSDDALFKNKD